MSIAWIFLLGAASAPTGASVYAISQDRFRKTKAGVTTMVAGVAPWIYVAMALSWISSSVVLGITALVGSIPLHLAAFFLDGIGSKTVECKRAAVASLLGMFAGVGFFTASFLFAGGE